MNTQTTIATPAPEASVAPSVMALDPIIEQFVEALDIGFKMRGADATARIDRGMVEVKIPGHAVILRRRSDGDEPVFATYTFPLDEAGNWKRSYKEVHFVETDSGIELREVEG